MDIKQSVNDLTSRPMNRKEFLASTAAVALAAVGVTTILKAFKASPQSNNGYGSSPYGGTKGPH